MRQKHPAMEREAASLERNNDRELQGENYKVVSSQDLFRKI
jgi:hypothetical protein